MKVKKILKLAKNKYINIYEHGYFLEGSEDTKSLNEVHGEKKVEAIGALTLQNGKTAIQIFLKD